MEAASSFGFMYVPTIGGAYVGLFQSPGSPFWKSPPGHAQLLTGQAGHEIETPHPGQTQ